MTSIYIDGIRLSDARTMKFNSLTGGAIGQIASVREVTGTGGGGSLGITDTWLHYDHIGNVMNTSTSSGALGTTYNQDAWGNVLASATTGQWASTFSGRHQTTKEYDPDAALYYFWQRWYDSSVGLFRARGPFDAYLEHPYGYAADLPTYMVGPEGRLNLHPKTAPSCACDPVLTGLNLGDFLNELDDVTNAKVRKCVRERWDKSTIRCDGPLCASDSNMQGAGGVGGNTVTICSSNLGKRCGKFDKIHLLMHEYAHNCGMPDEETWPRGGGAPPLFGRIGLPGTGPGGVYICTGK